MPSGRGERCFGFLSSDGRYAHCSREEFAGPLEREGSGTYAHYLGGGCKCGKDHVDGPEKLSIQAPVVGIESNGRPPENGVKPRPRVIRERRWQVTEDEFGAPVEHVRLDLDDGSKRIWWERGGQKDLGGLDLKRLPLYGTRHPNARDVIIVEGEQAADALASIMGEDLETDVLASVLGAPQCPRPEALADLSRYETVYLWPDNDDVGRQMMQKLGEQLLLNGRARERIQLVEWVAGTEKGADAADFVTAGGRIEALGGERCPFRPFAVSVLAPAERTKHPLFTTARIIGETVDETIPWVVEPWVAAGSITELAGKVKAGGKTTFMLHMVKSLLTGTPFLGKTTTQTPVVLLSEQGPRSLRAALSRAELLERDDLSVLHYHLVTTMPWEAQCGLARDEAQRIGARVVVVDTLGQFASISGDAENDAGKAMEVMRPIQQLAATSDLAVIVLRHDRKGGGDVGESARGSSAYAGAVDIVLRIRRGDGHSRETVRIIDGLSRFDETPDEFVVELTNRGYEARGTSSQVAYDEAKGAIWRTLSTSEGDAQSKPDVCKAAEVTQSTGGRVLDYYVEEGIAKRVGGGKRGDPYLYWRPPFGPGQS